MVGNNQTKLRFSKRNKQITGIKVKNTKTVLNDSNGVTPLNLVMGKIEHGTFIIEFAIHEPIPFE